MTTPRIRDLVTLTQIAHRLGRPQTTVSSWRRRDVNFPKPAGGTDASPLFDWDHIDRWRLSRPPGPRIKHTETVLIDHAAYFWSALQQTGGRVSVHDGVQMAIEFLAWLQLSRDSPVGVVDGGPAAGKSLPPNGRWPNVSKGVVAAVRVAARSLERADEAFSCVFKVLDRHPGIEESLLDELLIQMGRNLESEDDLSRVGDDVLNGYATRATRPIGGWSITESRARQVLMFADQNADSLLDLSAGDGSLVLAASSLMPAAELTGLENDHAANRLAMARAMLARCQVNMVGSHSKRDVTEADVVVVAVATQGRHDRRGLQTRIDPSTIRNRIRRALELTAEGGRAFVLVPRTIDEASQGELRVAIASGHVEGVVGLPEESDAAGEGSSLWILSRSSNPSPTVLLLDTAPARAAETPSLGHGYWTWRESGLAPEGGVVIERHTLADTAAPLDPGFWTHKSRAAKADHRLADMAAARIATLRQRTREFQAEDPHMDVKPVNVPHRTIAELSYQGVVSVVEGPAAYDRRRTDHVPEPTDVLIDVRGGRVTARLANTTGERPTNGGQILRVLDHDMLIPAFVARCLEHGHGATINEKEVRIQHCEIPMASLRDQRGSLEAIDRLRAHSVLLRALLDATEEAADALGQAVAAGALSVSKP